MVFCSAFPRCDWRKSQWIDTNKSRACSDWVLRYLHQRWQNTPNLYPEDITQGGSRMADQKQSHKWLPFSQSFRRAYHYKRYRPAVEELCCEIRTEWKSRLSPLFPPSVCQEFLEKFNDIALLADLMGHESIETTRIYLRRSSAEQQEIVDRVITW